MDLGRTKHMAKKLRSHIHEAAGEGFWEDLSTLLPAVGPRIDIFEHHQQIHVIIELPGVCTAEQIQVATNGKVLKISGELRAPYPVDEEELFRSERYHGRFNRTLELPKEVVPASAHSDLECGLLTLTFEARTEVPEQVIPIHKRQAEHDPNRSEER